MEPSEKINNLVWFLLDKITAFSVEVLSLYVPWINRVSDLKYGDLLMMSSLCGNAGIETFVKYSSGLQGSWIVS